MVLRHVAVVTVDCLCCCCLMSACLFVCSFVFVVGLCIVRVFGSFGCLFLFVVRLFACLFVCLFVCLFACLLACLFACLCVCLSTCLFVCLFVCGLFV